MSVYLDDDLIGDTRGARDMNYKNTKQMLEFPIQKDAELTIQTNKAGQYGSPAVIQFSKFSMTTCSKGKVSDIPTQKLFSLNLDTALMKAIYCFRRLGTVLESPNLRKL